MNIKYILPVPFLLILSACPSEEIRQYKVAKEAVQIQKSNAHFSYQVPSGWQQQSPDGMRQLSFAIPPSGDVSAIMLPGKVGDLLGNVNRWRGQVGLEPVTSDALKNMFTLIKMGNEDALLLNLKSPEGKPDKAMLVVLLKKDQQSWFFKLTGPIQLIQQQGPAFKEFLSSIQFKTQVPVNNPFAVQAQGPAKPTYTLPEGWSNKAASQMRLVSIATTGGKGDLSVIALPGAAGDLLGNINRWRGQVGLPPVKEDALKSAFKLTKVGQEDALLLELYAPEDKDNKAMRVALVEKGGSSWFFKLSGTREVIKAEADKFATFLGSVGFPKPTPSANTPGSSNQGNNPTMPQAPNQAPAAPTSAREISYQLPDSWEKLRAANGMRYASFKPKDQEADISVVALGGNGGSVLDNINRWRRQLGLQPTGQNDLQNSVKELKVDGAEGYSIAIYTDNGQKGMLVAALQKPDKTWFIKLSGTAEVVKAQQPAFDAFVQSIQFKGDAS